MSNVPPRRSKAGIQPIIDVLRRRNGRWGNPQPRCPDGAAGSVKKQQQSAAAAGGRGAEALQELAAAAPVVPLPFMLYHPVLCRFTAAADDDRERAAGTAALQSPAVAIVDDTMGGFVIVTKGGSMQWWPFPFGTEPAAVVPERGHWSTQIPLSIREYDAKVRDKVSFLLEIAAVEKDCRQCFRLSDNSFTFSMNAGCSRRHVYSLRFVRRVFGEARVRVGCHAKTVDRGKPRHHSR